MLLEIKGISELSLAFGATWFVQSMVIAAILLAIAAANVVVLCTRGSLRAIGYAILFASLALALLLPADLFVGLSFSTRAIAGCVRVALPVFGAGLVFASSFRQTARPSAAMGWNLVGAMFGGLGEYLSLITGVQMLGVGVMALNGLSLDCLRWLR
jgi:hypothetical protein